MFEAIKSLFTKSSTALAVRPTAAITLYTGNWTQLETNGGTLVAFRWRCSCGKAQLDYTDFSPKALKAEHSCPKCGALHCAAAQPNMPRERLGQEKPPTRAVWIGDQEVTVTWGAANERYRPADDPADFGMRNGFGNPR